MSSEQTVRRIGTDETISLATLHSFLWRALRHEAINDALIERVALLSDRRQLDVDRLAPVLPGLIAEVIEAALEEDWLAIAQVLVDESGEIHGAEEGGRR